MNGLPGAVYPVGFIVGVSPVYPVGFIVGVSPDTLSGVAYDIYGGGSKVGLQPTILNLLIRK